MKVEWPTVPRFAIVLSVAIPFAGLVLSHLAGWHDEFGIPKPAVLVPLWVLVAWILVANTWKSGSTTVPAQILKIGSSVLVSYLIFMVCWMVLFTAQSIIGA